MRKMVGDALTKGGHEVVGEAGNGVQAVAQYQALKPEVTTLDITMPEKDGLAALKEIIALDPAARIVMCSALGQAPRSSPSVLGSPPSAGFRRSGASWTNDWLTPDTSASGLARCGHVVHRNGAHRTVLRSSGNAPRGACSSHKHDGPPPLREAALCWTHVLSSPAAPLRTFRLVKQAIHAPARWQPQMPEREGRGHKWVSVSSPCDRPERLRRAPEGARSR